MNVPSRKVIFMRRQLTRFLKVFLPCFVVSVALPLFLNGLPLWGLPAREDLVSATVTDLSSGQQITVTEDPPLDTARNLANFLTYVPGNPQGSPALLQLTYLCLDGTEVTVSASRDTIYYKERCYPFKQENIELFFNLAYNFFFAP